MTILYCFQKAAARGFAWLRALPVRIACFQGDEVLQSGDIEGAIKFYSHLIERLSYSYPFAQDTGAVVFNRRAHALFRLGEHSKALSDCAAAIDLLNELRTQLDLCRISTSVVLKDLSIAYSNQGLIFSLQGDAAAAIKSHDSAIQINSRLCRELQRKGRLTREIVNSLAMMYGHRGLAYRSKGDLAKAVKDYREAIDLRSSFLRSGYSEPV